MKEYLIQRFLRNNHNKYHKYCKEWVENVTPEQIQYFIEEKKRLNLSHIASEWNGYINHSRLITCEIPSSTLGDATRFKCKTIMKDSYIIEEF